MGTVFLTLLYFVLMPPFAWLARRAGKREAQGWAPVSARADAPPTSQY